MNQRLFRKVKDPFRRVLEASPTLYCAMARLKTGRNREVVSRSTDLLIESFPRSGTTFMIAELRLAAPSLRIASHVHHQAHVQLAVRYGVPTFVLIREPMAACVSATVRLREQVPFVKMLRRWCTFYEALESIPGVTFISFESLTTAPSETVSQVMSLAGLSDRLVNEVSAEEALAEVEAMGVRRRRGERDPLKISTPTAERKAKIEAAAVEFERQGGPLLERANAIHARIRCL